jgi:hypothetical protein
LHIHVLAVRDADDVAEQSPVLIDPVGHRFRIQPNAVPGGSRRLVSADACRP